MSSERIWLSLSSSGFRWPALAVGLITVFALAGRTSVTSVPQSVAASNESALGVAEIPVDRAGRYAWLSRIERRNYHSLAGRLAEPAGFLRVDAAARSFADWLRHLPVAPENTPVQYADGKTCLAADDTTVAAVVALRPRGSRLLGSGNMMLRLRAEWWWSAGASGNLAFHFTNGDLFDWRQWAGGFRPRVSGRTVEFEKKGDIDPGRDNFCAYLETLFQYASTLSLLDDTRPVEDDSLAAGDVFLQPGRPGSAVMVLDVATDAAGRLMIMLGQGGTPPRSLYVLRAPDGGAWFPVNRDQPIQLDSKTTLSLRKLRRWVE